MPPEFYGETSRFLRVNSFHFPWFGKKRRNSYAHGQAGENKVYYELRKLGSEWRVRRNISINSRGNIDFVVVGPPGIFSIEVKNSSGQYTYFEGTLRRNGTAVNKDWIYQAAHEANSVNGYLKLTLGRDYRSMPIVVIADEKAELNFGPKPVEGDVYIIGISWLVGFLNRHASQKFSSNEISAIYRKLCEAPSG
jgi:hypothetical protein